VTAAHVIFAASATSDRRRKLDSAKLLGSGRPKRRNSYRSTRKINRHQGPCENYESVVNAGYWKATDTGVPRGEFIFYLISNVYFGRLRSRRKTSWPTARLTSRPILFRWPRDTSGGCQRCRWPRDTSGGCQRCRWSDLELDAQVSVSLHEQNLGSPALLISTSMPPQRTSSSANIFSTAVASEISAWTLNASPPASTIFFTVSSAPSSLDR